MKERFISNELVEGMAAWTDLNAGKATLKTHRVALKKRQFIS